MLRHRPLTALLALAALSSAAPAAAAEWHHVSEGAPRSGSARDAAEAYLKDASGRFDLARVELRFQTELRASSFRTVRFSQWYRGKLPVFGGDAAVHVAPDGSVKLLVLDVARGLDVSPVPSVDEASARKIVEARRGMSSGARFTSTLGVLPEEEGPGKLVWQVDVPSNKGGHRYTVDAHAGVVVLERPLAVNVLGRVYPISSANTPETKDLELPDIDASEVQHLNGWAGGLAVTNYVSGDGQANNLKVEQTLLPSSGEDFLYDPPADAHDAKDAFAQVGIYYHLTRMRDFFTSTFGLDMTPASWQLVAVANMQSAGAPLDNAYFAAQGIGAPWEQPNQIAIGQGTDFDFADDSDVFLHEFTHYVGHNAVGYSDGQVATSEYGLSPFGGAIDEGLADYFACTVNGDPILGEASLAPFGATRDLGDTHKVCPDDLDSEVHDDGELIGSLSWSIRTVFGAENGDQLIWGAMSMLTHNPSFGDYGRALQQMTDDLVAEGKLTQEDRATLDGLLASRGLDDCDEVLDVGPGNERKTTMLGLDVLAQAFGGSCEQLKGFGVALQSQFHFSVTPAATDTQVRFHVDLTTLGTGDLDWGLYVRTGKHVGFANSGFVPTVSKYDYAVEHLAAETGDIVIDATSSPPFDPSQTYYMVISNQNCPLAKAVVSSSAEPVSTGAGGSGGGGGSEAGAGGSGGSGGSALPEGNTTPIEVDGCSCRVAGEPSSTDKPWAGLAGLLVGAAALLRRSKR